MQKLLFVCSANRLRGLIAEHVFRSLLLQVDQVLARQVTVSSAGVTAAECVECKERRGIVDHNPLFSRAAASSAVAALAKRGIDISDYQSQEIDVAMVEAADLILTAVKVHKQGVLEVCPAAEGKVFTLMEFSGEELHYLFDDCHNLAPELRRPDFGNEPAITEALIVEAESCLAKVLPKILDFRR